MYSYIKILFCKSIIHVIEEGFCIFDLSLKVWKMLECLVSNIYRGLYGTEYRSLALLHFGWLLSLLWKVNLVYIFFIDCKSSLQK